MFNIFSKLKEKSEDKRNKAEIKDYLSHLSSYCNTYEFILSGNTLEIHDKSNDLTNTCYLENLYLETVKNTIKKHIGIDQWTLLNNIIDFNEKEHNYLFEKIWFSTNDEFSIIPSDDFETDSMVIWACISNIQFLKELKNISHSASKYDLEDNDFNVDIFKLFFSDEKLYKTLRHTKYKLFEDYIKDEEDSYMLLGDDNILTKPCSFVAGEKLIHITLIDERVIIFYDNKLCVLNESDFKLIDGIDREDIISKINNKFASFKIPTKVMI